MPKSQSTSFFQYSVGVKEENDRIRNEDFDFDSYFFDYGHYSNWCSGFRQDMMAYYLCYELLDLQDMTESELLSNMIAYLWNNPDFDDIWKEVEQKPDLPTKSESKCIFASFTENAS